MGEQIKKCLLTLELMRHLDTMVERELDKNSRVEGRN